MGEDWSYSDTTSNKFIRYFFNAWENSEEIELSIDSDETNGARDRFVFHNNPFRWKLYYCTLETGSYFVNGRFYSPCFNGIFKC